MKLLNVFLAASSLLFAAAHPGLADNGDNPTYRQQMENLWIATGDPTYARLAGLTPAQIEATKSRTAANRDGN